MSEPWPLNSTSGDVVELYYAWAAKNYKLYDSQECLCNWFPLRVLIGFAAANGVPVRLDYWPGHAPTHGKRYWDTKTRLILDSHGGTFGTKSAFLAKAQGTVTARMIGSMNSVAIELSAARAGDLICRDYSDAYWHVELITGRSGNKVIAESGNVPASAPKDGRAVYKNLGASGHVYQGQPRRWEFEEIFARPT